MEMSRTAHNRKWLVRLWVGVCFFLLAGVWTAAAQDMKKKYSVRNGKMYIELSRQISDAVLDSFITQYDLQELDLKHFIKKNSADSLRKKGWQIEVNDHLVVLISKPLMAVERLNNPADRIIFAEKPPSIEALFPHTHTSIRYGANRFRNKAPFAIAGPDVTFFLRGNTRAGKVILAGSFNNWSPDALAMTPTDSGWIAHVRLEPGKYWYKFIIDDNWGIDPDNQLRENDGLGNTNSVFYKPNTVFTLPGFNEAKRVYLAGSFNDWHPRELQMIRTAAGWQLPLYLAEGTHTYKFVVDGKWHADPQNPERLPDGHNGYNSVIRMGKPYVFHLKGYDNAKQVFLVGNFNNWREDELQMQKSATGWELPYVIGPGNFEYKFRVDGKWIPDPANDLNTDNRKRDGNSLLINEPNYTFRLKGHEGAREVYLAGDFNNWSPDAWAMKREGKDWVFPIHLPAGKHRYKFVVDGQWILDPFNKLWEQNEHGTGNSILWRE